jgi:hypothetical protein
MREFSTHVAEQMHRTSRLTFTPILLAHVGRWKEDRVVKVNVNFGMSSVTNFITNAPHTPVSYHSFF